MISIIIPLYNKEKYITQTINSILNQTYKDFEILVINDGSTDESLEVVNTFTDERINIFSIKNSGVSVARNIGVEKSNFDYVAFLDADDYWDKAYLSEIVELIEIKPDQNVFATGRISKFSHQEVIYDNYFLPKKGQAGKVDYLKVISHFLPPVNSSNSVFRKSSLLQAGLFKPGQRQHEDHDLWLRLCSNDEIMYINKPLSFYRKDIIGSGSQFNIRFLDFKEYLQTILETKNSINKNRNRYFKRYYHKFILLTFIKHQAGFTKEETKKLLTLIQDIVSPFYYKLILLVNILPSGLTYKLLSQLKR